MNEWIWRLKAMMRRKALSAEGEEFRGTAPWGEAIHGSVVRKPKAGYLTAAISEWNDSVVSLFVEGCGGTLMLTVMCILFGDAAGRAEELHTKLATSMDGLFPGKETASA